jgi:hypothetical protein
LAAQAVRLSPVVGLSSRPNLPRHTALGGRFLVDAA